MTVTLLAPWALAAAALLAIPVILHLFKPRKVRRTPFSSLRWLHLTPQKLSRRIQWHQVLLFLLRAAFLMLLVLALAKPLFSSSERGKFIDRFIVLDVSHSMQYRASNQPAPLERARQAAADLVARNRPGDRTAVLLTGTQTRLLTPLSPEPENYLPVVRSVQAGLTETDLGSALPVIKGLLARGRSDADAEVWFLTDNQKHAWRQGGMASFLEDASGSPRVRVVDVGVAGPQNAWITRTRLLEFGRPARRVLRAEIGCVGDEAQERVVHVDPLGGMTERIHSVVLTPGRPTLIDFDVPQAADLKSGVVRFHLEPPDALPGDDEAWLNLDAQGSLPVLLVEGGTPAAPAGLYLRTALEALADVVGQPLQMTVRFAAEVQPQDVKQAEAIFLADVPELPEAVLAALEERVRAGAGLAIFLGEAGKPAFLNEKLFKPLQPADSLLPGPVQREAGDEDRLAGWTGMQWSHPLLAGLGDPLLGDLALVRSRHWYRFTGPMPESAAVLARIDDEAPGLIDRPYGAGKVVIFNTGAGDRWCDLPRRKSFVPLIDRLLNHLTAAGARRTFAVGEVITLPLGGYQTGETVAVLTPSGRRLTPAVRALPSGRALVSLETTEAGVHWLERSASGASGFPFVVQVGRGDSALEGMDAATLKQWWAPTDVEVIRVEDLARFLDAEGGRHGLWPWLLLAAGLFLLAEMYLVHRLCPQSNPHLTANVVGRRGLLRPTASHAN